MIPQTRHPKRTSQAQTILTIIFIAALMIANILAQKQLQLPFGITFNAGNLTFPITYILSDVFCEVYGYKWSRRTCYIGFGVSLAMAALFTLAIHLPYAEFWQDQEAFATILGDTPRIVAASLVAFMIGDYINDNVFKKLKAKHIDSHKGFKFRAILSSVCGNIIDSTVFVPLAFAGKMPLEGMLISMISVSTVKTLYESCILPVTEIVVKRVSAYERKLCEEEGLEYVHPNVIDEKSLRRWGYGGKKNG